MSMKMHNPAHPGEILADYLEGGTITISQLAARIREARKTVSDIVNGKARVTVPMARRLARALGTTPGIWLRLQEQRDEWELSQMPDDDLRDIEPFEMAAG